MYPKSPILIVEDQIEMQKVLVLTLMTEGISNIVALSKGTEVQSTLANQAFSLILLDLRLPDVTGFDLLNQIRETHPDIPVIMLTGEQDLETAVHCMRLGARDYLTKPVARRRLIASVRQALEMSELREEYRTYIEKATHDTLEHPDAFEGIVAESSSMRAIFQYIETIARSPKPVLITGESGVGKELIAQAVHRLSDVNGPFVSETVAGYDDAMFSDALFGHVPGAFTGASTRRAGLVENARSGTLFLDEIGDLSQPSQVKLLRLIQEREYRALGSDNPERTTARFVFATNRNLLKMRDEGAFRGDLYYRISTHSVEIPPLRDRKRDIAPLVRHLVIRAAAELRIAPPAIPQELYQLLSTYNFPGNVRELEAMVFDAVTKVKGRSLSLDLFVPHLAREEAAGEKRSALQDESAGNGGLFCGVDSLPTIPEAQKALIAEALRRAGGNQGIAARLLGISRTALNKRIHQREFN